MSKDSSANEIYEDTPFSSPLVDAGFKHSRFEDIRYLKDDPEKIVRITERPGMSNYDYLPVISRAREEMHTLRDDYGFNVPNIDIVNYPNKKTGDQIIYVVTDRIHGEDLADKQFTPEELPDAREKLDDLFCSMVHYYRDVSRRERGSLYKRDLANHNRQFMWGRKKGDEEDKIWLVDIGSDLEQVYDSASVLKAIYTGYWDQDVLSDIFRLEHKHDTRFDRARAGVIELMDELINSGQLENFQVAQAEKTKVSAAGDWRVEQ